MKPKKRLSPKIQEFFCRNYVQTKKKIFAVNWSVTPSKSVFLRNLVLCSAGICRSFLSDYASPNYRWGDASYLQFEYYQRLATAATFLQKKLCCPGAMTRRWAPTTRYTLWRYAASIIKDLIWFNSIKLTFLVKSWLRAWLGAGFWNIEEITVSWKAAKNTRWISKSFSLWNYRSINDFQD